MIHVSAQIISGQFTERWSSICQLLIMSELHRLVYLWVCKFVKSWHNFCILLKVVCRFYLISSIIERNYDECLKHAKAKKINHHKSETTYTFCWSVDLACLKTWSKSKIILWMCSKLKTSFLLLCPYSKWVIFDWREISRIKQLNKPRSFFPLTS